MRKWNQWNTVTVAIPAIKFIIIIFFRIVHKYCISKNAASKILALIYFALSMLHSNLISYLYYSSSNIIDLLGKPFPKTLHGAVRDSQVDCSIEKQVFVVCPKESCNALYKECKTNNCTLTSYGKVCGASLGYTAHLSHGKQKWKAFKTFQFIPPSATLNKLCSSEEFLSLLAKEPNKWDDEMDDIQDGQIWKELKATGFFDSKYNLALMFNVDWYRPFKRSEYKVAAMMLTVLNLPREERFKKKWTIIAGS